MAFAELRAADVGEVPRQVSVDAGKGMAPPRLVNMLLPVAVLIVAMPLGLWVTGEGNLFAGSGSTSVLWASLAALAVVSALMLLQRTSNLQQLSGYWMEGAGHMLPIAVTLVLALTLGDVWRRPWAPASMWLAWWGRGFLRRCWWPRCFPGGFSVTTLRLFRTLPSFLPWLRARNISSM